MKRSETHSETRTALCNAVKRTVKHTVKHSAKRCNLQWFSILSRSKGCCIQKSPSFFFPQGRNVVNYPVSCCVSLCVHCVSQRRARFTAFYSAARISLSVCCELGWRAAIALGKRRGVECPLPPHAAMLDKYLAFVTMKRF